MIWERISDVTLLDQSWSCSPDECAFIIDVLIVLRRVRDHMQTFAHRSHDDVIKWKYFPRYWPLVRGIHRSPVTSPHKGQWRGALMFSWTCAWIKGWVNNGEAGDLRRHRAHYDVIVMQFSFVVVMLAILTGLVWISYPYVFKLASLALRHSYGCPWVSDGYG